MAEKTKILTISFGVVDVAYDMIAPYIIREKPLILIIPIQDGVDKQLEMEVKCIEETIGDNSMEFRVYPIFVRREGGDE